jgi:hypothetical protein
MPVSPDDFMPLPRTNPDLTYLEGMDELLRTNFQLVAQINQVLLPKLTDEQYTTIAGEYLAAHNLLFSSRNVLRSFLCLYSLDHLIIL